MRLFAIYMRNSVLVLFTARKYYLHFHNQASLQTGLWLSLPAFICRCLTFSCLALVCLCRSVCVGMLLCDHRLFISGFCLHTFICTEYFFCFGLVWILLYVLSKLLTTTTIISVPTPDLMVYFFTHHASRYSAPVRCISFSLSLPNRYHVRKK